MRLTFLLLLAFATIAHAAPRRFTIAWDEHGITEKGEVSGKTTFRVVGAKLHYEMTYEGPDRDKPSHKPRKLDVVIKNRAAVDKGLAALDKIAPTPHKVADPKQTRSTACLTIGTKKRCETYDGPPASPGYKALEKLTEALLENVPSVE